MKKIEQMSEKDRIALRDACDEIDDFLQNYLYYVNPKAIVWWTKLSEEIGKNVPAISKTGRGLYDQMDDSFDPFDPLYRDESVCDE